MCTNGPHRCTASLDTRVESCSTTPFSWTLVDMDSIFVNQLVWSIGSFYHACSCATLTTSHCSAIVNATATHHKPHEFQSKHSNQWLTYTLQLPLSTTAWMVAIDERFTSIPSRIIKTLSTVVPHCQTPLVQFFIVFLRLRLTDCAGYLPSILCTQQCYCQYPYPHGTHRFLLTPRPIHLMFHLNFRCHSKYRKYATSTYKFINSRSLEAPVGIPYVFQILTRNDGLWVFTGLQSICCPACERIFARTTPVVCQSRYTVRCVWLCWSIEPFRFHVHYTSSCRTCVPGQAIISEI